MPWNPHYHQDTSTPYAAVKSYKNRNRFMRTNSYAKNSTTSPDIQNMADPAQAMSINNLPLELQKEIFKHSPSTDLISLSLVSKAFREIAAANLYRNFHIIFPDDDDCAYDSPVDGLASCLDTFVTSDYDYAQHIRDITFDTLVGGDKAERAYRQFTYDNSCGKFMNTLFLLTLRKAKSLEKFKWNIRVELSRPVFQALHRIEALQHLHLRLHAGFSLYEPPPPLLPSFEEAKYDTPPGLIMAGNHGGSTALPSPPPDPKSVKTTSFLNKWGRRKSLGPKKVPSTFSGFRDLKTLSILDMDTLEYLNEIQECIKNSSGTLHKLKLSFSESLANQSRKVVVENDEDDSDPDDPFPPGPLPPVNPPGPQSVKAIEDEKKAQEAVLSTIFGFEAADLTENEESGAGEEVSGEAASKTFIEDVRYHISRLLTAVHGPGSRVNLQKDVLDALEKATQKYTEATKDLEKNAAEAPSNEEANEEANVTPETAKPAETVADAGSPEDVPSLFGTATRPNKDKNESSPEDVDIESPETSETNDWEATEADVQAEETQKPSSEGSMRDVNESDRSVISLNEAIILIHKSGVPPREIDDAVLKKILADHRASEMRNYIRETRGLALRTLEIYLIPIKASVLSRAIDFKVLTRITLLNVGAQSPFWTLLSKENKSSPLPLSKIFTDNVTLPFLNLVSELECVTELLMLERSSNRQKVESSTPKTTVTKEQIRALALRKHAKSLRKLMIKNENDYSWDVSEKTILLLCRKGKALRELAVSCGIKTIHTLFQNISGLKDLHALHIISFRAEDTCVFVIQELRRFAIDILSCHPSLQLEYIGFSSTLAKITRSHDPPKPTNAEKKNKGKGKAKSSSAYYSAFSLIGPGSFEGSGMSEGEDSGDEDSDGGGEGVVCGNGVRLEVAEGMRFCEVQGVRVFRKDVVSGRL